MEVSLRHRPDVLSFPLNGKTPKAHDQAPASNRTGSSSKQEQQADSSNCFHDAAEVSLRHRPGVLSFMLNGKTPKALPACACLSMLLLAACCHLRTADYCLLQTVAMLHSRFGSLLSSRVLPSATPFF